MTYILQRIVKDRANETFGQVWNQELVLSVNCDAKDIAKAASDTKYVTLQDFMNVCKIDRVCWQHGDESEFSFIQRAEKQIGEPICYVIEAVRTSDWKLEAIRLLKIDAKGASRILYDDKDTPFMTVNEVQHFDDELSSDH